MVLVVAAPKLLLIQIVLFQEFGPELLWRSGNVWPPLWRKVHEIPIRPHRVDMIRRQFRSPEMKNLSILLPEYMHHWQLHIIGVSLALVTGLIGRLRSRNQRRTFRLRKPIFSWARLPPPRPISHWSLLLHRTPL